MKRYMLDWDEGSMDEHPCGGWVMLSDHEAALAAAVAKEREECAEEFSQFAQAVRYQCRGRIGETVANMALDRAAHPRKERQMTEPRTPYRKHSDTPRTDQELWVAHDGYSSVGVVEADFARQLERELAEARKDAERYRWLRDNYGLHIAEFERKKRFFGKCGREGKLFEPIPAPAAD
jgi:hypothetical protein